MFISYQRCFICVYNVNRYFLSKTIENRIYIVFSLAWEIQHNELKQFSSKCFSRIFVISLLISLLFSLKLSSNSGGEKFSGMTSQEMCCRLLQVLGSCWPDGCYTSQNVLSKLSHALVSSLMWRNTSHHLMFSII